jgi:hypothetical protein
MYVNGALCNVNKREQMALVTKSYKPQPTLSKAPPSSKNWLAGWKYPRRIIANPAHRDPETSVELTLAADVTKPMDLPSKTNS